MTPEDTTPRIEGEPAVTTSRRRVTVLLCTLWVVLAIVRGIGLATGHPGDRVSLVFALIAGVAGAVGLTAALWPERGQR